jgi:hypothetical protein
VKKEAEPILAWALPSNQSPLKVAAVSLEHWSLRHWTLASLVIAPLDIAPLVIGALDIVPSDIARRDGHASALASHRLLDCFRLGCHGVAGDDFRPHPAARDFGLGGYAKTP